jgi:hypothetical protein
METAEMTGQQVMARRELIDKTTSTTRQNAERKHCET